MFKLSNLKMVLSVLFISIWFLPASAQDQKKPLNPIDCLNAVEHLELALRSHIQLQCIVIPIENCESHPVPEQCFTKLDQIMRDYFAELRQMLPNEIEGKRLAVISYKRGLARLDDFFSNPESYPKIPSCVGVTSIKPRYCELTIVGTEIIDLRFRARLAGISTP